MIGRIRTTVGEYPRQFWVMAFGMLVNSIGSSLVWPFLTIIVREQLNVPLTSVTLLFTANSVAGLLATSYAGPAVDRFGRRAAMLLGLAGLGSVMLAMSFADSFPAWLLLMALQGAMGPLYRIGSDAMVADLVSAERRVGAFAILRMNNNLGIAIGPAIGGFVAAVSHKLGFYLAAGANLLYLFMILLIVRETLPQVLGSQATDRSPSGYGPVLRDRRFVAFCVIFIITTIPSAIMMMLLAVYAKENFGLPESRYGFIMATNAAMVVLFQVAVTRVSRKYPALVVLALGALLYGVGAGSVALGSGFWAFWTSMVVLTLGELLLAPTGSAFAANLAPVDMRGRYMGLYGLTWGLAFGIGPVVGGWLSDNVSPLGPWVASFIAGLIGVAGFWMLAARTRAAKQVVVSGGGG